MDHDGQGTASCVTRQASNREVNRVLEAGVWGGLVHWPLLPTSAPRQANLEPRGGA